jgi:hypothetical protein
MLTPTRSRAPLFIHHPMTGQRLRPRRIPERPSHHPGMTRPPRQGRNITISRHFPAGNLANNVQNLRLKCLSLLHRHSIRIIFHLQTTSKRCQRGRFFLAPFSKRAPKRTVPFATFSAQYLLCSVLGIHFLNDALQNTLF